MPEGDTEPHAQNTHQKEDALLQDTKLQSKNTQHKAKYGKVRAAVSSHEPAMQPSLHRTQSNLKVIPKEEKIALDSKRTRNHAYFHTTE